MRVLLADDQAALRSAVRLLLEHEPGVTIVAEAPDASTLLADALHLRPDLVLLDWELPGLDGFSSARSVLESLYTSCPRLHVIVLSGRPEAERLALASGATTFVSKADPPERLLDALRRAKEQGENRRHG